MTRTTSNAGRAALMAREGCRLAAYRDSAGVPTIGVGHTGRAAPPAVEMGMTITQSEAEAIFAADLAPFEAAVDRAIPASATTNQFDACVSLAFNIGTLGFAGSTVVHKLEAGDPAAAADAFLMWEHPPELSRRRAAEHQQFLSPDRDPSPVTGIRAAAITRHVAALPKVPEPASQAGNPSPLRPHLLPKPPGFWARLAARFTRKAA